MKFVEAVVVCILLCLTFRGFVMTVADTVEWFLKRGDVDDGKTE